MDKVEITRGEFFRQFGTSQELATLACSRNVNESADAIRGFIQGLVFERKYVRMSNPDAVAIEQIIDAMRFQSERKPKET